GAVSGDQGRLASVIVDVPRVHSHGAQRPAILIERHSGPQGDLSKPPSAFVMKQEIRHGVVGDKYVQLAVGVVVEKRQPHALADVSGNAGSLGDIGECAVSVVMVKLIGQAWVVP